MLTLAQEAMATVVSLEGAGELVEGAVDDVVDVADRAFLYSVHTVAAGSAALGLTAAWEVALKGYVQWLEAAGRSPGTIRLWTNYLRSLARQVDDPFAVNVQTLVAFLARPGWGAESRRSARAALRGFYSWAELVGCIDRNPTTRLPSVPAPRGRPRPTPEAVVAQALVATRSHDRNRLMIMLAAYGGLRAAEIAGVHRTCHEDGHLRVLGKGRRTRMVPLHPALEFELDCEWRRRDFGGFGTGWRYQTDRLFLFPGQQPGTHMTPGNVTKILSWALGAGYTGHTLRHRFASKAYEGSRDLRAVQELLGHSRPETTARYTLVPDDAMRQAVHSIRVA